MKRRLALIAAALAACAQAQSPAPATKAPAAVPAQNWVLPLFDRDGFRSLTLRGEEARGTADQIAVKNLNITAFSGGAAAEVDAVLLSQAASVWPKTLLASGEGSVRFLLLRDGADVTGTGWDYDHNRKRVFIRRDVRVVIHAPLNDILK